MARNFGIWNAAQSVELDQLSDRTAHGEVTPSGPRIAQDTPRKSNIYFFQSPGGAAPQGRRSDSQASNPALFIRDVPALKRGKLAQALIDIFAVAVGVFLACLAGLAVAIPFLIFGWLLFFH